MPHERPRAVQNASTWAASRVGSPFTPERPFGPGQVPAARDRAMRAPAPAAGDAVTAGSGLAEGSWLAEGTGAGLEHAAARASGAATSRRRHALIIVPLYGYLRGLTG